MMMESGYFNNGNFREYSYFAGGGENFAVLKREFPVTQTLTSVTRGRRNYRLCRPCNAGGRLTHATVPKRGALKYFECAIVQPVL